MARKDVFAGHGDKSLTVETSASGVTYLWVKSEEETVLVTLTPTEKQALAQALFEPDTTTHITTY